MDAALFSVLYVLLEFIALPATTLLLLFGLFRLFKVVVRNAYTVPVSQYPRPEPMSPAQLDKLKLKAERGDKAAARTLVDFYAFALETPREERLAQYQYWRKILNSSAIRKKTDQHDQPDQPPAEPGSGENTSA